MNWQSFKSLYELFEKGQIKSKPSLIAEPDFKYYANQTKELLFTKREIIVKNIPSFKGTFEKRYLRKYYDCLELLDSIGENTPHCKFDVKDILILKEIKLQMDSGELEEIRRQIIASNETRRGVSLMFFKHEKHLDSSEALERAVKNILKIDAFADDRDFQYLYVLQCIEPRSIVLCENLHFLKMPEKPRKNRIELWYAGGRNIEKLKYIQHRDIPIFYIGDWDHDGLDIFRSVKEKIPQIQLLTPNGPKQDIIKTEHKSFWKNPETPDLLSHLPEEIFLQEQKDLIKQLITENCWIVEESNDLITLICNTSK